MSNNIALYIHWPFCKSKCPYCDFNSHVVNVIRHGSWLNAYLKQLEQFKSVIGDKKISSIYFGGGTPTLMKDSTLAAILEYLHKEFSVLKCCEITVEANPTSVESAKIKRFKYAGTNRISLGVQALNQKDLHFLGREHSVDEALKALEVADRYYNHISFDLIYARPGQTVKAWEKELKYALTHAGEHMSLYQLTIEKGTPFYRQYKNAEFVLPAEHDSADMFDVTHAVMKDAGYTRYEISNYAKPKAQSRHNLAYWTASEYLGVGPGAHSRVIIDGKWTSLMMLHDPMSWRSGLDYNNSIQRSEILSKRTVLEEYVMMGLRTIYGINKTYFHFLMRKPFEQCFDPKVLDMLSKTHLRITRKRVRLRSGSFILLNSVVRTLLDAVILDR